MLQAPDDLHATVARLALALGSGRFALKMRTGFADHNEFPGLLAGLAAQPLARLTVHGRTRPQGYRGKARWDLIALAAREASAPVIASGDIVDRHTLVGLCREAPHLSGALIGRGALRNPWVFLELATGASVRLSRETLGRALLVFAFLQDLDHDHLEKLMTLAGDGLVAAACGTDVEAWDRILNRLAVVHPGGSWPETDPVRAVAYPFARTTLGRVKMLWNYLRSALPPLFFAPETLRARSVGDLVAKVDALAAACEEPLLLEHRPEWDWLYAGGKRDDAKDAAP